MSREILKSFESAEEDFLSEEIKAKAFLWFREKYKLTDNDYLTFFHKSYSSGIRQKWFDLFNEPEASEDTGYRMKNYTSHFNLDKRFLNLERFSLLVYTYLKESYKVWELRTTVLDDINKMHSLKGYHLSNVSKFKPFSRK